MKVDFTEGFGLGVLYPKTNAKVLNKEKNDGFYLSGYGLNAVIGLRFVFFDDFFIQPELKGGFINLPNIRTTPSVADKAKQTFFFSQFNVVFGGFININKKKRLRSTDE